MKYRPVSKDYTIVILFLIFGLVLTQFTSAYSQDKVAFLLNNAKHLSKQEQYLQALNYVNQAIRLQPQNIQAYNLRGFIYGRSGQYIKAIQNFTIVIKYGKTRIVAAHRFRADCFFQLGNMKAAIKDYHTFLKVNPKDGKVWSYLAEAYYATGDIKNAHKSINRGLKGGSHWAGRLQSLRNSFLLGEQIEYHEPLRN